MYPVVEVRDRADREPDDRVVSRVTDQRAAHAAGGKAVAGLVVGPAVVVDRIAGAELPVRRELEVDRVPRRDGRFLPGVADCDDLSLVSGEAGLGSRRRFR
jgi:hypothetical protein